VRRDALLEEELESRWEAAPVVGLLVALQLGLGIVSRQRDWLLWGLPWWIWLVFVGPELVLVVLLAWSRPRRRLEQIGHRRTVALALLAVIGVTNALLLVALIGSILAGEERSGSELLLKGGAVWSTNVITFGLWFWAVDRGGPVRRLEPGPPPDFQFPQMENPQLAAPGWQPQMVDYLYLAFTNAIAFSPTDAMPLTRRAKLLMLFESAISAVTILLVAARSVNILG
jgi:uncharacterized membrane protein